MEWQPIEKYSEMRKKALFRDAEGFVFVGEGFRAEYGQVKFWDYEDEYEAVEWFDFSTLDKKQTSAPDRRPSSNRYFDKVQKR